MKSYVRKCHRDTRDGHDLTGHSSSQHLLQVTTLSLRGLVQCGLKTYFWVIPFSQNPGDEVGNCIEWSNCCYFEMTEKKKRRFYPKTRKGNWDLVELHNNLRKLLPKREWIETWHLARSVAHQSSSEDECWSSSLEAEALHGSNGNRVFDLKSLSSVLSIHRCNKDEFQVSMLCLNQCVILYCYATAFIAAVNENIGLIFHLWRFPSLHKV